MNCPDVQESLGLYIYGDLPAEERGSLEAHMAGCEGCRKALEDARRLHEVLKERQPLEAAPELLVECRQALEEALDREQLGWAGLLRGWLSAAHLAPATAAVVASCLVVIGFGAGWVVRPRVAGLSPSAQLEYGAAPTAADLSNMRISGISRVAPDPKTGDVRITMDAQRRVTLEGSLDDPRIQQVLVSTVKSYDNPGIRRDTLDALRARASNPNFREALLYSMRHDPNAGNRLEALDTVRSLDWGPDLEKAFLDAVERDDNPGVRVAAIDVLMSHLDDSVLPVLERLAGSERNRYVRLKCAAAVRELGKDGN